MALSQKELEEIKEQLKAQVLNELKDDETRKMEELKLRREEEKAEQQKYIETMKASTDPWVDIMGWVQTKEGVKVELEWNNAFADYLRANGVAGSDDEQIVQKWITILLRDMAEQIIGETEGSNFE